MAPAAPVDGDGGRRGLARSVTETAALWKSATEGSCDRKEESAVDGVRVAEDTDDLVMAAQEQAEQGQDAAQGQAEDEQEERDVDELRVRLLPHQEAENTITRFETRDEDDHRDVNRKPGESRAFLF